MPDRHLDRTVGLLPRRGRGGAHGQRPVRGTEKDGEMQPEDRARNSLDHAGIVIRYRAGTAPGRLRRVDPDSDLCRPRRNLAPLRGESRKVPLERLGLLSRQLRHRSDARRLEQRCARRAKTLVNRQVRLSHRAGKRGLGNSCLAGKSSYSSLRCRSGKPLGRRDSGASKTVRGCGVQSRQLGEKRPLREHRLAHDARLHGG